MGLLSIAGGTGQETSKTDENCIFFVFVVPMKK
jgi:hypothetical protein